MDPPHEIRALLQAGYTARDVARVDALCHCSPRTLR